MGRRRNSPLATCPPPPSLSGQGPPSEPDPSPLSSMLLSSSLFLQFWIAPFAANRWNTDKDTIIPDSAPCGTSLTPSLPSVAGKSPEGSWARGEAGDQRQQQAELLSPLMVQAGGSDSVLLSGAHQRLMWSLAAAILPPNQLPWCSTLSQEGQNERLWRKGQFKGGIVEDFCLFFKLFSESTLSSGALKGLPFLSTFLNGLSKLIRAGTFYGNIKVTTATCTPAHQTPSLLLPGGHSQTSDSSNFHFCPS